MKSDREKPRIREAIVPLDEETLATAIRKISQALEHLLRSGLTARAVIALLHDDTKVSKTIITTVLESLGQLERRYCRKEK